MAECAEIFIFEGQPDLRSTQGSSRSVRIPRAAHWGDKVTKAFLQRERKELKAAVNQAYQLATAHRRRAASDVDQLFRDLRAIESLTFASIADSAKREISAPPRDWGEMRKYSCILGGTLLAAGSFMAVEVWAWPSKLENIHSGVPQLMAACLGGIILFTALIWPKRRPAPQKEKT